MVEPIRMIHFADLHIGMENYGRTDPNTGLNGRVTDFLARLDDVVTYAYEHDADLVLFAGDAFRSRSPGTTLQREFAQRIRQLSDAGVAVVLLAGNHDVPVMSQRASSVEIFDTLAVPRVTVAQKPAVHRIATKRGPVQVLALPYPIRQRLLSRDQFRSLPQEQLDRAVSEALVGILESLAATLDPECPSVVLGHFSVDGALWGSERSIMVGRDVTLPVSALNDPRWQYVALGHIHQHQDLNSGNTPPIVYSGSLERVDFGEERQPKGFCWVQLGQDQASWRYVEVGARRFVTLRADVRGQPEPLEVVRREAASQDLAGAVVRLIVRLAPEQESGLRDADLMPLLAPAFYAQVNREIVRAVRDRLDGMEPAAMTDAHLLECYLLQTGRDEVTAEPYLRAAAAIFSEG
ncbi:MAG: exonuclease SbcCD subunit D [Anaerolineae bacterium]|nr:exonuclease SbcCD subunit D [Anaerolineae bacterium]